MLKTCILLWVFSAVLHFQNEGRVILLQKNVVGYARKSIQVNKDLDEKEAVLYQFFAIEEHCKKMNYNLIHTFSDIGYSGVLRHRPELNEILSLIKEKQIDVIVFYGQERFSRDFSDSIELMLEIMSSVKQLDFVVDNLSTESENFRSQFLLNAAKAAESRREITFRLWNARRVKVQHRKLYRGTKKPLGYTQPGKQKLVLTTSKLTRDLDKINDFRLVQFIFLCFLSNMNLGYIAKLVQEEFGVTNNGKKWSSNAVKYILKNPVYAGILKSSFLKDIPTNPVDNIQKLISVDLFQFVQAKLALNKQGNLPKERSTVLELSICGECIKPLKVVGNELQCINCISALDINIYTSLLRKEFIKLLKKPKSSSRTSKAFKVKKQILESKLHCLKIQIQAFKKRHGELKDEFRNDLIKLKELQDKNEKKTKLIQQQLLYETSFYHFLFGNPNLSNTKLHFAECQFFLHLPYLVIVNFSKKEIHVKFHDSIFKKEDNDDFPLI